ncbi:MAG: hypothetical protein ABSH12_08010, partial [Endomicrobiales bacterium]
IDGIQLFFRRQIVRLRPFSASTNYCSLEFIADAAADILHTKYYGLPYRILLKRIWYASLLRLYIFSNQRVTPKRIEMSIK